MDLPFVDLAIIQAATNGFSDANKLGEGGFGPVYMGTLRGGREIAVKRLSTKSKQGVSELKNEMKLIAKLQHRNLVRVLGCCVEREEKLIIYEYLPNKSLDVFLFDENKRSQLDWARRRLIIAGIARGLLYLHEDSLLKVIHRDLKASNVLLDNAMNPKISDFGMSKIFRTDETEVNTAITKIFGTDEAEDNTDRVVGTIGYIAPEYALDGIFSEKSDVYSFGVLLLEILSGQKNGRSHFEQHGQTLLRRAWQLWLENRATELVDRLLGDSYIPAEAIKFIHIGLLCVQENAEERPTMSLVVVMLRSEQMVLPEPTQPPTFSRQRTSELDLNYTTTTTSTKGRSTNEVTISDVTPR